MPEWEGRYSFPTHRCCILRPRWYTNDGLIHRTPDAVKRAGGLKKRVVDWLILSRSFCGRGPRGDSVRDGGLGAHDRAMAAAGGSRDRDRDRDRGRDRYGGGGGPKNDAELWDMPDSAIPGEGAYQFPSTGLGYLFFYQCR